ncbi:TonB family protein [Caulobacter ginsengisoli]|uniref:TonB family protein n=1 Tax=Caulobacter ginsengisoli TaxID=400775 RepID=A0ABU0IQ51_9CAUL|nr:energy transducer TonB [Caulobacter ginsengisoli]MDQ0463501.1 TonB family protein [Caulobacter ginsengisoli]
MIGLAIALLAGDLGPPRDVRFIENPQWLQRPSWSDVSQFFPQTTAPQFQPVHTILVCAVTASGRLTRCTVSVTPAGYERFGETALKLSTRFVMAPRTPDGRSVAGRWVRVPIIFQPPSD